MKDIRSEWEIADTKEMDREDYLNLRIYTQTKEDKFVLKIWRGKARLPYANYYFGSDETRQEWVNVQKENHKSTQEEKQKRAKERKDFKHTLKVGDVLYTSWGYDQTNVDFYQVVALVGKKSVKVRRVADKIHNTPHCTYENVVPVKDGFVDEDSYKGETITKRVLPGNGLRISSFEYASPWDGKPKYQTNSMFGH